MTVDQRLEPKQLARHTVNEVRRSAEFGVGVSVQHLDMPEVADPERFPVGLTALVIVELACPVLRFCCAAAK